MAERPTITLMPTRLGGDACFGDSRLGVEMLAGWWWHGSTLRDIVESYPDHGLDHAAIIVCCWYQARYGARKWQKRWGVWLKANSQALWYGEYGSVPMPPQKEG